MAKGTWIAVDWGTSQLRAWLMRGDGHILERRQSDAGMGTLARDGFEPALRALVGDALPAPVLACGMVGSRQGWIEAPYLQPPARPPARPRLSQCPVWMCASCPVSNRTTPQM